MVRLKLKRPLENENWNKVLSCNDVNSCANSFVNKLQFYINESSSEHFAKNKRLKSLITQGLITSIREQDRLKKVCTIDKIRKRLIDIRHI